MKHIGTYTYNRVQNKKETRVANLYGVNAKVQSVNVFPTKSGKATYTLITMIDTQTGETIEARSFNNEYTIESKKIIIEWHEPTESWTLMPLDSYKSDRFTAI